MNQQTSTTLRNSDTVPGFEAVKEAAQLLRFSQQIWRDYDEMADGWELDYAVDTDIVKMYSDPVQMSRYAQVFDKHNRNNADAALADLLGDFILNRWQVNERKLWVISPHDEELFTVMTAIQIKAKDIQDGALGAIEEVAHQLSVAMRRAASGDSLSATEVLDQLDKVAWSDDNDFLRLLEWIDGKTGPQRELARLGTLPRGRIKNLLHHTYYGTSNQHDSVLPKSQPITDEERKIHIEFYQILGEWMSLLRQHQTGQKTASALRADARVMATLEWVNTKTPAQDKRKLLLITGSDYLYKAAQIRQLSTGGRRNNFATAYLRDPRCFVGADGFFAATSHQSEEKLLTEQSSGLNLGDWLNCFFPEVLKEQRSTTPNEVQHIGDRPKVKFDILQKLENHPDIHTAVAKLAELHARTYLDRPIQFPNDLYKEWTETVVYSARQRNLDSQYTKPNWREKFDAILQKISHEFSSSFSESVNYEKIKEYLQNEVSSSQEEVTFWASMFGVVTLLVGRGQVTGVPALRFDCGRVDAQQKIDALFDHLWKSESAAPFEIELKDLYEHLSGEGDPHNYHAHLIHAVIFAAKGHWAGTHHLAMRAWTAAGMVQGDANSVIKATDEVRRVIRGREAAYLLAVATRRMAKSIDDLENSRGWLSKAEEREDDDRKSDGQIDPRFLSEKFAIDMAEIQFKCFATTNSRIVDFVLQRKLDQAESILLALERDENDGNSNGRASNLRVRSINRWVTRQVCTLTFIAAILTYEKSQRLNESDQQRVMFLLDKFLFEGLSDQKDTSGKRYPDKISNLCYHVARLLLDSSPQQSQVSRDYLNRYFHQSDKVASMTFEVTRDKRFKALTQDFR
jgi:hypothetical protein